MLIEYFKVVVFQKYATFSGRARRSEFWYYILASTIISIALAFVDLLLGTNKTLGETGLVGGIYSLITFIPGITVSARRLHDIGKSGWFVLLFYIPFITMFVIFYLILSTGQDLRGLLGFNALVAIGLGIYFIILFAKEGMQGTNIYGPDPKNPEYSVEDHLID